MATGRGRRALSLPPGEGLQRHGSPRNQNLNVSEIARAAARRPSPYLTLRRGDRTFDDAAYDMPGMGIIPQRLFSPDPEGSRNNTANSPMRVHTTTIITEDDETSPEVSGGLNATYIDTPPIVKHTRSMKIIEDESDGTPDVIINDEYSAAPAPFQIYEDSPMPHRQPSPAAAPFRIYEDSPPSVRPPTPAPFRIYEDSILHQASPTPPPSRPRSPSRLHSTFGNRSGYQSSGFDQTLPTIPPSQYGSSLPDQTADYDSTSLGYQTTGLDTFERGMARNAAQSTPLRMGPRPQPTQIINIGGQHASAMLLADLRNHLTELENAEKAQINNDLTLFQTARRRLLENAARISSNSAGNAFS